MGATIVCTFGEVLVLRAAAHALFFRSFSGEPSQAEGSHRNRARTAAP